MRMPLPAGCGLGLPWCRSDRLPRHAGHVIHHFQQRRHVVRGPVQRHPHVQQQHHQPGPQLHPGSSAAASATASSGGTTQPHLSNAGHTSGAVYSALASLKRL